MKKYILTDTGYWIGLVDPNDQYHEASLAVADLINEYIIIVPWPCLYETISTHLTRRRERLIFFEGIISKPNIILFDDDIYKENALRNVFELNRIHGFTFSLTDSVIREILKDLDVNVDFLVTFNEPDFKDVCDQRLIEIISE